MARKIIDADKFIGPCDMRYDNDLANWEVGCTRPYSTPPIPNNPTYKELDDFLSSI